MSGRELPDARKGLMLAGAVAERLAGDLFISEDPIGFSSGDVNFHAYVGNDPVSFADPFGLQEILQNPNADFGLGYTGRVDPFSSKGGASSFEIHVAGPDGKEIGVVGPEGWLPKHGFSGKPPDLPRDVVNKINGRAVEEMRARGLLPEKGTADIKDFIMRYLPADLTLVCLLTNSCELLWMTLDCTLHPGKPECQCGA